MVHACILALSLAASDGFPVTATDALGVSITLARAPRRIVSLAPSTTECAFAIGVGDRVVGVTRFCNYPPEAKTRPKLGGYRDVVVEKVVAARPDLVLATRGNPRQAIDMLRRLGLNVFAFETERLDDVERGLTMLGKLTGERAGAAKAVAKLGAEVEGVTQRLAGLRPEDKPLVFFGGYDPPFFSPGPGTYLDDLIQLAGGRNIAGDARIRWPQLSLERIVAKNPDVIVCGFTHGTQAKDDATALARFRSKPAWRRVKAVQSGRVYVVDVDPFMRPTPRLGQALRTLAECFHPSRFGKPKGRAKP